MTELLSLLQWLRFGINQEMSSGTGMVLSLSYIAGRFEFLSYLPSNTQGVIVRPIGEKGVLIAATDTQRGFGKLDQVLPYF